MRPHVVALRANQKLKMVNSDNTTHNIHPLPANNREWNKAEPAGIDHGRELPARRDRHPSEVQRASRG